MKHKFTARKIIEIKGTTNNSKEELQAVLEDGFEIIEWFEVIELKKDIGK